MRRAATATTFGFAANQIILAHMLYAHTDAAALHVLVMALAYMARRFAQDCPISVLIPYDINIIFFH